MIKLVFLLSQYYRDCKFGVNLCEGVCVYVVSGGINVLDKQDYQFIQCSVYGIFGENGIYCDFCKYGIE